MKKIVLALIAFSSFAFGHGIYLNLAKNGNDSVDIYANYGNNKPCVECRLVVSDGDKVLIETKLDKNGKFNYKMQNDTKLTFKVNDNYGHLIKKEL